MKKIKLNLDTLNVQSFRPSEGNNEIRGTVQAEASFDYDTCKGPGSCVCQTLEHESCYQTCGYIESCRLFC